MLPGWSMSHSSSTLDLQLTCLFIYRTVESMFLIMYHGKEHIMYMKGQSIHIRLLPSCPCKEIHQPCFTLLEEWLALDAHTCIGHKEKVARHACLCVEKQPITFVNKKICIHVQVCLPMTRKLLNTLAPVRRVAKHFYT